MIFNYVDFIIIQQLFNWFLKVEKKVKPPVGLEHMRNRMRNENCRKRL